MKSLRKGYKALRLYSPASFAHIVPIFFGNAKESVCSSLTLVKSYAILCLVHKLDSYLARYL